MSRNVLSYCKPDDLLIATWQELCQLTLCQYTKETAIIVDALTKHFATSWMTWNDACHAGGLSLYSCCFLLPGK